jgi:hypothetical protein
MPNSDEMGGRYETVTGQEGEEDACTIKFSMP